jgi:D-glycero-D-manno-heptose 1,7-bisphosphate phosphatase
MRLRPAVFFDRDGTLIEEAHYCGDPARVKVLSGVPKALERLKQAGFLVFVITNQSGIGRGLITEDQYRAVEAEMLRQAGPGSIDGVYFCPDAPGAGSRRRKPEPAMVLEAATAHGVDLGRSFFVGDKADDIECGRRAGVRTILVRTGYGADQQCAPEYTAADAPAAIDWLLQNTDR